MLSHLNGNNCSHDLDFTISSFLWMFPPLFKICIYEAILTFKGCGGQL